MAVGGVVLAVAKWALGVGATVVAGDLLNDYYQKNKDKIGKTFDKWMDEIKDRLSPPKGIGKDLATLIGGTKAETQTESLTGREKEQTNGLQGSMDYTEFNEWLKSEAGQKFLNETAVNLRTESAEAMNPSKQEQIEGIQGTYDAGTYQEHYDSYINAMNKLTAKPGDFEFTDDETVGEILPNQGEENYDDKTGQGFDVPSQEGITDKTDENLGTNNIQAMDWMKWAEEEQAKRWAREDEIRKETQEREDTAWQRGVEDMRKSGINVNLVGAQPAASGGGITQASGQNLSGVTTQMNIDLDKMQQIIDQAFKGDENDKDRFIDLFGNIIQWVAIIGALKGKK